MSNKFNETRGVNKKKNFGSNIDFFIEIAKEKIPGRGEDSYLYFLAEDSAMLGVFDGCGGSGAKRYEKLGGHTGAYIASRAVAGAARNWFMAAKDSADDEERVGALKEKIQQALYVCNEVGGEESLMKGSMTKDFPTTLAAAICERSDEGISALCVWAGDSRCYLLDRRGLMQLTDDDLAGYDAMENLTADGVLTNVVSFSKNFTLHTKRINITSPCIIFTATDGCFGYFSTPMEFEDLLLGTLMQSKNPVEWEAKITSILESISGDDSTLSGLVLGYGSFKKLKKEFSVRADMLYQKYVRGIETKSMEEKIELWKNYKVDYSCYLKS